MVETKITTTFIQNTILYHQKIKALSFREENLCCKLSIKYILKRRLNYALSGETHLVL